MGVRVSRMRQQTRSPTRQWMLRACTCFALQYGGPMVLSVALTAEPCVGSCCSYEAEDRRAAEGPRTH